MTVVQLALPHVPGFEGAHVKALRLARRPRPAPARIDYAAANKAYKRQKTALTRALNSPLQVGRVIHGERSSRR